MADSLGTDSLGTDSTTAIEADLAAARRGEGRAATRIWSRVLSGTITAAELRFLDAEGVRTRDGRSAIAVWLEQGDRAEALLLELPRVEQERRDVVNLVQSPPFLLAPWREACAALARDPRVSDARARIAARHSAHAAREHASMAATRAALERWHRARGHALVRPTRDELRAAHASDELPPYHELVAATGGLGLAGIHAFLEYELAETEATLRHAIEALRAQLERTVPIVPERAPSSTDLHPGRDPGVPSLTTWRDRFGIRSVTALREELGFDPSVAGERRRVRLAIDAFMDHYHPDEPGLPLDTAAFTRASAERWTPAFRVILELFEAGNIDALNDALGRPRLAHAVSCVRWYMDFRHGNPDRMPTARDLAVAGAARPVGAVNWWMAATAEPGTTTGSIANVHRLLQAHVGEPVVGPQLRLRIEDAPATRADAEAGLRAHMRQRYPDDPARAISVPDVEFASELGRTWPVGRWLDEPDINVPSDIAAVLTARVVLTRDQAETGLRALARPKTADDAPSRPSARVVNEAAARGETWNVWQWRRELGVATYGEVLDTVFGPTTEPTRAEALAELDARLQSMGKEWAYPRVLAGKTPPGGWTRTRWFREDDISTIDDLNRALAEYRAERALTTVIASAIESRPAPTDRPVSRG